MTSDAFVDFPTALHDAVTALLRNRPDCPCHGLPCVVDDKAMRDAEWQADPNRYMVTIHWTCSQRPQQAG